MNNPSPAVNLSQDMKQYQVFHMQAKQAEAKLKHTESQRLKVEQQANKASKKFKDLEKQKLKVSWVRPTTGLCL